MTKWMTAFLIVLVLAACVPAAPPFSDQAVTTTSTGPLTETPTGAPASAATSNSRPVDAITPNVMASPLATPLQARALARTENDIAPTGKTPAQSTAALPPPDHVVVVVFENHDYSEIVGNACCVYINQQIQVSAVMTQSFALTHPSKPNYLDLFSGFDQGVTDDACFQPGGPYATANLGQQLIAAGHTFAGFSEDLPAAGSTSCGTTTYARKHNPWVDFSNVPSADNLPFSSFPADFTTLPTVSFVVPNLCNDMNNCTPSTGDAWLSSHLDGYIAWAKTHNSLFIVTFDEGGVSGTNHIPTFFEGPMVRVGHFGEHITHYNVLRTLEALYCLPYAGQAANVATITDIWATPEACIMTNFLPLIMR